ncbi:hypothetical protein C8Q80DRAFT_1124134 [Daedaleopsis nitida]|nr:hypothetical protein C8Q80DRAFT_1124134 [Daedaleopsis nitida]
MTGAADMMWCSFRVLAVVREVNDEQAGGLTADWPPAEDRVVTSYDVLLVSVEKEWACSIVGTVSLAFLTQRMRGKTKDERYLYKLMRRSGSRRVTVEYNGNVAASQVAQRLGGNGAHLIITISESIKPALPLDMASLRDYKERSRLPKYGEVLVSWPVPGKVREQPRCTSSHHAVPVGAQSHLSGASRGAPPINPPLLAALHDEHDRPLSRPLQRLPLRSAVRCTPASVPAAAASFRATRMRGFSPSDSQDIDYEIAYYNNSTSFPTLSAAALPDAVRCPTTAHPASPATRLFTHPPCSLPASSEHVAAGGAPRDRAGRVPRGDAYLPVSHQNLMSRPRL